MNEQLIDTAMYVTYGLFGLAALTALIFPLVYLITDLKKAKNALIGIGGLALVLFVGYSMATNEIYEGFAVGPNASQWIGGGINATLILVGLAFLAALYTEVAKIFK
ncbi:MAG: hypothetical protein ACOCUQ_00770 [Bacteroidota bacterium]